MGEYKISLASMSDKFNATSQYKMNIYFSSWEDTKDKTDHLLLVKLNII